MKHLLIIISILIFLKSFAQTGGNNTYEFLNLPFSARTAALGGNLISVKDDDLNQSFQNPSLLNSAMHNKMSLTYINYITDINYGYAAYARSYDSIGNFSVGMQFLDYGKFQRAEPNGDIIGRFFANEYALNMSYSKEIDTLFSIGGTLKTIYSLLETYWSIGNALDAGVTYNNSKHLFTAAAVVKNFGYQWKPYIEGGVREPMPFEVQLGFSKKLKKAPFRMSLIFTHLEKWDLTYLDPVIAAQSADPITGETIKTGKFRTFFDKFGRHVIFGTEILLTKNFNIRIGYNHERRAEMKVDARPGIAGFSFGAGIKIYKFSVSYGFAKYHLAGTSNHITISTNLSDFVSKK